ncbi:MAG: ATP-binding protein [Desulfovibrio sp.]
MKKKLNNYLGNISPWVVIGMSSILVVVVLVLAFMNYNREKQYMVRILSEKGSALIKAFEAGTRTGMMGMFGQGPNLQILMQETATQSDILYIAVVDSSGEILAHSNKDEIGRQFISADGMNSLNISQEAQWRVMQTDAGEDSFEVYKRFLPALAKGQHKGQSRPMQHRKNQMMQRMMGKRMDNSSDEMCQPGWMKGLQQDRILDTAQRPAIFIGMDVAPFEEAIGEDISLMLMMSGILLLLGLGGVVSLFWMQSHIQSKKLLQDSEALTAEMVANIPEGLVVSNPDGQVTYVNDIALALLTETYEETSQIVGRFAGTLLPDELWDLCSLVSKETPVVHKEMELPLNDERKLPIAAVVTNIITEEGANAGHLFMVRDLSQVKELQEEIRKADKMAAVGHLAAGVAHEVRNPLSSIKGYATYFGSLFEEGSDNRKAAEVMTSEVDRLNRVISELLEMARPADIKLRNTDVATLLEGALRLVKQEAEGAGVSISLDISEDVGAVALDPDRITQALINLYVNAIQAMPEGGSLSVDACRKGQFVHLKIADTGTGLPDGDMSQIFDPYFTTKQTGTGLGLAIVRKIIEAHSGEIKVEQTGIQGTVFSINLPMKREGAESA